MTSVVVVVLGDVGRSPRMQYHCKSIADLIGASDPNSIGVSFIGYRGEPCIADVENNPRIRQCPGPPACVRR